MQVDLYDGGGLARTTSAEKLTMFDRYTEIRRRWEEIRARRWRTERGRDDGSTYLIVDDSGAPIGRAVDSVSAVAIAHAPEDVRWMMAEIETLREQLVEAQLRATGEELLGKSHGKSPKGEITLATYKLGSADADELDHSDRPDPEPSDD